MKARKDYEDVTDHIKSLKSQTKGGEPSLKQQRKIQSLSETLQQEQMNTGRERERVIEVIMFKMFIIQYFSMLNFFFLSNL